MTDEYNWNELNNYADGIFDQAAEWIEQCEKLNGLGNVARQIKIEQLE